MPDEKTEEANIIPYGNLPIDDVACCDCGGVVTCFMVPDSVWDGLGFALGDFACIACVGQRLNPALNAEGIRKNPRYWLEKEIWRQRKRFKLVEGQKSFQSMKVQIPGVFVLVGGEGVTSVPKEVSISRGEREVASPLPETADGAPVRKDDRDERPSVRQGKGPSERNSFVRSGSGSEEGDQAAR